MLITTLSCLDRSNLGEYSISAAALNKELSALGLPTLDQSDELNRVHRKLFSAVRVWSMLSFDCGTERKEHDRMAMSWRKSTSEAAP